MNKIHFFNLDIFFALNSFVFADIYIYKIHFSNQIYFLFKFVSTSRYINDNKLIYHECLFKDTHDNQLQEQYNLHAPDKLMRRDLVPLYGISPNT